MRKSFLFPFLGKIKRYFRLSPFLAEDSHHYIDYIVQNHSNLKVQSTIMRNRTAII